MRLNFCDSFATKNDLMDRFPFVSSKKISQSIPYLFFLCKPLYNLALEKLTHVINWITLKWKKKSLEFCVFGFLGFQLFLLLYSHFDERCSSGGFPTEHTTWYYILWADNSLRVSIPIHGKLWKLLKNFPQICSCLSLYDDKIFFKFRHPKRMWKIYWVLCQFWPIMFT